MTNSIRRSSVTAQAGVVLLGALVPLLLIGLAGGDGSLGWVALAGGAACASGLMLGATQRLLPALALALIAAAALALAAAAARRDGVRELAFPAAAAVGDARPGDAGAEIAAAGEEIARVEGARTAAAIARPLTRAQFVRRQYADLEAGRFAPAWARLPAAVQAQAAGFDAWRSGYHTTISQRVEDVRLEPGGFVRHDLVTVDRTPCGTTTERRYEVLWRLSPTGRDFTATYLEAVQLAGVDPALAC